MEQIDFGAPRISVRSHVANEYNIRLTRQITEPDDFCDEFHALDTATENDIVKFDILTEGGSMDTAIMLIRAMNRCPAHTMGWIGPTCASAGTAIALACDSWEVDEMSSFMIHSASFGIPRGKANDVARFTEHNIKMIEKFVRQIYTGFLTEEELILVLDGREMYFEGEDLVQRLENYAKLREQKELESQQEEE